MAGPGNSGGNSRDVGSGLLAALDVREKLILALLMFILGGAGAGSYLGIKDPRPNPWTSIQAEEAHEDLEQLIKEVREDLEQQIRKCREDIDRADRRLESRMDNHISIEAHPSANERLKQHDRNIELMWKVIRELERRQ